MTYDFILMNPPYNVGNKITSAAMSSCDKCVCLMPLSQYKSNELYRHVESMELADPKLFVDADITKNLCICTLENKNVDKYSWEDMQFESFDKRYIEFYKRNKELTMKYHIKEIRFKRCDNATAEDFDIDTDYVDSNRLVGSDNGFMDGGTSQGYIWNVLKRREIQNIGLSVISGFTKKGKNNFTTWAYNDCRSGLSNKILWGLGKQTVSSSCSIAIPQIDWETISDTPLWKEGKYDESVLDVMDLMWDEEKNNIVRKI